MKDPKKKPGRPTIYTDELGATICLRLTEGESLRAICRDDDTPHITTVMAWLFDPMDSDDPRFAFRDSYARARQAQAELMAEEIMEIADDSTGDATTSEDGKTTVNPEHIARSRLRVDSRKWVVSKLLPKVYGDKLQHTGDGGGNIKINIVE